MILTEKISKPTYILYFNSSKKWWKISFLRNFTFILRLKITYFFFLSIRFYDFLSFHSKRMHTNIQKSLQIVFQVKMMMKMLEKMLRSCHTRHSKQGCFKYIRTLSLKILNRNQTSNLEIFFKRKKVPKKNSIGTMLILRERQYACKKKFKSVINYKYFLFPRVYRTIFLNLAANYN